MNKLLTALLLTATAITAQAEVYKKAEKPMPYSECIDKVKQMASAVPAKVVVSSSLVTTVRFKTAEGSLLATCSEPDRKMSLAYTTNPF